MGATYVVQSTSPLAQLDDLNSSIQPIQPLIRQPTVPSLLQPFFEMRAARLFEAKYAGTSLVEAWNQRDVEA